MSPEGSGMKGRSLYTGRDDVTESHVTHMSSSSTITNVSGDLFSAPEGSILVHACNTKGSWGAGIALAFRARFPEQFEAYKRRCKEKKDALVGTCLLLPAERYTIACLFTSRNYGRNKDRPDQILAATKSALQDLVAQNTKGKELHAWYENSCHIFHLLTRIQSLQLWQIRRPMGADCAYSGGTRHRDARLQWIGA